MKKFLTAMFSFALILFMGFAVGCANTDGARVRYVNGSIGLNYGYKISGTKMTITATENHNDISGGVTFELSSDNTYGKDYKATFSNVASGYTVKVGATEVGTTAVDFDSNGRITITISSTTQLSGANVKVCDIKISAATTNEKKIKAFNDTTYSVYISAYTAPAQTPAA